MAVLQSRTGTRSSDRGAQLFGVSLIDLGRVAFKLVASGMKILSARRAGDLDLARFLQVSAPPIWRSRRSKFDVDLHFRSEQPLIPRCRRYLPIPRSPNSKTFPSSIPSVTILALRTPLYLAHRPSSPDLQP
ncbi:hypothetical protein JAAARDRAFT_63394 [Jaapia argillacea MUCL 33604]|uniref:Uncharacterized protein n=1 Tax=Jaapia argillacea MUCL 33604 TaxID=933084 RepID=A0A067P5G2_9AGAM|nr:hypothetical protein JAAARDRAFT_63394 [Jaapia argillacea MUCL 33604]